MTRVTGAEMQHAGENCEKMEQTGLVMVVDDEPDMLSMLRMVISRGCGCTVISAESGALALKKLESVRPDVIVTDIKMSDLDGLELLRRVRELDPTISVIIMTGYGTIDMAVTAIRNGAYDFLEKPFEKDHIVRVVVNCLERTALLRVKQQLEEQLREITMPEGFIGRSPALQRALDLLSRVADTDATVLIRGESGTGKELAARALHNLSNRRAKKMVTVNCPALPEHILESELFGYNKGAFTGAVQSRKGLFLEADGSTILLDEIADISVAVQTKLLRVLQEKEIQPLGQNTTIKINSRVIASTNQDLETKIQSGEFREDLFYRLNVVTITMPTLREMHEDIPLLIHHYLDHYKKQYNREHFSPSSQTLRQLYVRQWPGNVRELQNTIKRLVLLGEIDLPDGDDGGKDPLLPAAGFEDLFDSRYSDAKNELLRRFSIGYLNNLLQFYRGNVTNAAAACGMERQGLQRIMRRYGVVSSDFKK